jgi:hypothetical protein
MTPAAMSVANTPTPVQMQPHQHHHQQVVHQVVPPPPPPMNPARKMVTSLDGISGMI